MYALKARDKMHQKEKDAYKERHSPNPKNRRSGADYKPPKDKHPVTVNREAKYVGTFSIDMAGGWKSDFAKTVKQQLSRVNTKNPSHAMMFVAVRVNMEGIKVFSTDGRDVIMAHALKRILYCTADSKKHLFAIVARNPQEGTEGVYTHVFMTDKKDQANELNQIASKAFKEHFASKTIQRQKKIIVQQNPQSHKQRRSPSPQPRSVSPHPPASQSSSVPPYNPHAPHTSSALQSAPTPRSSSAPQTSAPPYNPAVVPPVSPQAAPSGGQPWTVQQNRSSGIDHLSPIPTAQPKSMTELRQESGLIELEMATLQQRIHEIQGQMRELAGIEDAIVQLTVQMSQAQQQLEEKKRQHSTLQFQIQDLALQDHNLLQPTPTSYAAPPTSYAAPPPYPGNGQIDDIVPDFGNMSLEDADWFHEGIPREIAMEVLSQQSEGSFMVRQSSSSPGCYALTMKAPNNKILNYLIENVPGGVQLQGSAKTYPSIMELVHSYTINRDNLPCTLTSVTSNPAFLQGDSGGHGGSDSDEDDDYMRAVQYRLLS